MKRLNFKEFSSFQKGVHNFKELLSTPLHRNKSKSEKKPIFPAISLKFMAEFTEVQGELRSLS
jgi:hypothetical protein